MSWLVFLLACASSDDKRGEDVIDSGLDPVAGIAHHISLDAPRLLRRLSLDLRGTVPAVNALDAVAADPALVETYRDIYLEDALFEERMVQLLSERWHTQVDEFQVGHFDYRLDDRQEYAFERAVGQEPLRLMAHVAANDLPWTDIVTAEYTMANELLADLWPLERTEGEGWQVSYYTDGRSGGGVLGTNGLWWRYVTNTTNMNRGRAATVTKLLLCHDILTRPVSFSGSSVGASGVEEAIATEPACRSCHATIDPLAASLFGFYWLTQYNPLEQQRYHPERELLGSFYLGVEPAYFGTPVMGLEQLGQSVAADPRFYRCTAQTMAGLLWRRDVSLDDFAQIENLRRLFITEGSQLKPLIRGITDTPDYRVGALAESAPAEIDDTVPTRRMMVTDQLATALYGLTGFSWTYEGYSQLDNDTLGYRVMGGAVDGDQVASPQRDPGLTWALVVKRAAQASAAYVVERDLSAATAHPKLLKDVDVDTRPSDAAFEAQLINLHWRLLAITPDEARLSDLTQLWRDAYKASDATAAWTVVVSSLLRDPEFVTY